MLHKCEIQKKSLRKLSGNFRKISGIFPEIFITNHSTHFDGSTDNFMLYDVTVSIVCIASQPEREAETELKDNLEGIKPESESSTNEMMMIGRNRMEEDSNILA
jgi:hypothetical protein